MIGRWMTLAAALAVFAAAHAQEPAAPRRDAAPVSDEQKAQMEERLNNAWQQLSLREKMQMMKTQRALREMPADQRKFITDRIERFINMSPEERQQLDENRRRWENMSPEEREKAREEFGKRRHDFEEKWRQEHPGEEPPGFMHPRHRLHSQTNAPPAQVAPQPNVQK